MEIMEISSLNHNQMLLVLLKGLTSHYKAILISCRRFLWIDVMHVRFNFFNSPQTKILGTWLLVDFWRDNRYPPPSWGGCWAAASSPPSRGCSTRAPPRTSTHVCLNQVEVRIGKLVCNYRQLGKSVVLTRKQGISSCSESHSSKKNF